jgi:hypothetical protein
MAGIRRCDAEHLCPRGSRGDIHPRGPVEDFRTSVIALLNVTGELGAQSNRVGST